MSCFCFVFSLQNLYPNSDSNAKVKIPVVGENEFRQVPTSSFNVKRGVKKKYFSVMIFFLLCMRTLGSNPAELLRLCHW
jgi:hypothetical protein